MSRKLIDRSAEVGVAPRGANTAGTRSLLACGVVAGPLFLLVSLAQVVSRDGFDLGRHPLSALSIGGLGWIQVTNFVVSGVLALAAGIGIRRVMHRRRGGTWGPILVGAFGVGLIAAGIFVPDPALGFPPGTPNTIPDDLSWHAVVHGFGFVLAFGALTAACLVFARRDAALGRRGWAAYSGASAVAALALSMWPGQDGASVRYAVASVIAWAWISAIAIRLRSELPGASEPITPEIGRSLTRSTPIGPGSHEEVIAPDVP